LKRKTFLKIIDCIRFVHFSEIDVVRHPLVQDVIKAYARLDREKQLTPANHGYENKSKL